MSTGVVFPWGCSTMAIQLVPQMVPYLGETSWATAVTSNKACATRGLRTMATCVAGSHCAAASGERLIRGVMLYLCITRGSGWGTASRRPDVNEPVDAFLRQLSILHERTNAVAKLRSGVLAKRLAEMDKNTGELRAKVLLMMDQIEASFQTIRRKLQS